MITRDNPLSLYIQLKDLITGKIESGEWKEGDSIPTEKELQEEWKLSRTTVRQALTELAYEGVLKRTQGKGTFVNEKKLEPVRPNLTGFTVDMETQGKPTHSIVINQALESPNLFLKNKMNISENEKVLKLERIRLVDNIPIGYHESYLNISLTPNINFAKYDFSEESLYAVLKQEGVIFGESDETIEAVLPQEKIFNLLTISTEEPVLRINREVKLNDGEIYEYSKMVYRGDKYKYHVRLA